MMRKTTVYIPEDLKAALTRLAARTGRSEAELIREALATLTAGAARPRPRAGIFDSGVGGLAERTDDLLDGFGER
jgi:predicted transcriptional regulator